MRNNDRNDVLVRVMEETFDKKNIRRNIPLQNYIGGYGILAFLCSFRRIASSVGKGLDTPPDNPGARVVNANFYY